MSLLPAAMQDHEPMMKLGAKVTKPEPVKVDPVKAFEQGDHRVSGMVAPKQDLSDLHAEAVKKMYRQFVEMTVCPPWIIAEDGSMSQAPNPNLAELPFQNLSSWLVEVPNLLAEQNELLCDVSFTMSAEGCFYSYTPPLKRIQKRTGLDILAELRASSGADMIGFSAPNAHLEEEAKKDHEERLAPRLAYERNFKTED